MKKITLAIVTASMLAPASMAAVRPTVATISPAVIGSSARVGTPLRAHQKFAGVDTAPLVFGGLLGGFGIAAGAGAFNSKHHNDFSVSP